MASFNKVILIGNLTADVELKQSASGISVCSFNIAVNRKMSKNNECDFITCVAPLGNCYKLGISTDERINKILKGQEN